MKNITKGNWTINKHANTCVEVGNRSICSTGGYQSNVDSIRIYEENEANAKMIVVAGNLAQKYNLEAFEDLLIACKKAQEILFEQADKGRYPESCMAQNGGQGLGFMRDAIKKALKE